MILTEHHSASLLNHAGQISLEEFIEGAEKDPWVMEQLKLDFGPCDWFIGSLVQQQDGKSWLSLLLSVFIIFVRNDWPPWLPVVISPSVVYTGHCTSGFSTWFFCEVLFFFLGFRIFRDHLFICCGHVRQALCSSCSTVLKMTWFSSVLEFEVNSF